MSIKEILQSAYALPLEERKELTKLLTKNIEDPMLSVDPYFYERKKQLQQIKDDIRSGKMEMYDEDEFENEMDEFEKELILKYGN